MLGIAVKVLHYALLSLDFKKAEFVLKLLVVMPLLFLFVYASPNMLSYDEK